MKGVATILIPLLLASQLNTEKGDVQSNALTELILCYSTPIALTFIQSLCQVCFGNVVNVGWKFFLPVLILEGAEVCGTSYLLFNVFCNHSMTSGITLIMASFTLPSILNISKQIALAREIKNTFVIRLLRVIIALVAMVIQLGVLVCMVVQPNIIFSDTVSNQIQYTTQEKIFTVASLIGVSMGFCQNFLYSNLKIGSLKKWRIDVDKARPKINLKICIVKVGIYLLMAKCLLPEISWTLTEEHANLTDNFIDKTFKFCREHKFMFIYIYSTIFASYEGVLACKLHMQRISFFIPLTFVPLGCFGGVIGYCYKWSEDTNLFGVAVSCPNVDINSISMWVGPNAALWLSILFMTWYGLFPNCHSLQQTQRLFILPTRDSFFSSLGLLMKRKDDTVEDQLSKYDPKNKKVKEEENQSGQNEPFIYVCGTMWHETRREMLQLLKSLFSFDEHLYRTKPDQSGKDFTKEIHIIFDDAFETDKESEQGQRIPNEYVKKLVKCMEEASKCENK